MPNPGVCIAKSNPRKRVTEVLFGCISNPLF